MLIKTKRQPDLFRWLAETYMNIEPATLDSVANAVGKTRLIDLASEPQPLPAGTPSAADLDMPAAIQRAA